METDQTITHICKRTVVGTKPVKKGRIHRFTPLDRLMESHHHRMVYYYKTPAGLKTLELRMKLIESISETLSYYPMATGRPVKDEKTTGEWMIKCNDAGIRMVEARAKGSVERWLEIATHEMELELVYWEDTYHNPYYWAIVYVQVTQFEEGGLALGFSSIHALGDQTSASIFMKAWASMTLTGKMVSPPLFHSLPLRRTTLVDSSSSIHRPTNIHLIIDHYKSILTKQGPFVAQDCKTITFLFSDPMVQACINETQFPDNRQPPTPFEALSGVFWAAISRVKRKQTQTIGLMDMSLCFDARKLMGLDTCFFGNCMVYAKVVIRDDGSLTATTRLSSLAAQAISEAVKDLSVGIKSIHDLIEWLESNSASHGNDDGWSSRLPSMENNGGITCVNLEHLDLYSADFDSRFELVRVSYQVEPLFGEGRVVVLPWVSGEEGHLSRVVKVTLPGDEIDELLVEDDFISSLCPTVLVRPN